MTASKKRISLLKNNLIILTQLEEKLKPLNSEEDSYATEVEAIKTQFSGIISQDKLEQMIEESKNPSSLSESPSLLESTRSQLNNLIKMINNNDNNDESAIQSQMSELLDVFPFVQKNNTMAARMASLFITGYDKIVKAVSGVLNFARSVITNIRSFFDTPVNRFFNGDEKTFNDYKVLEETVADYKKIEKEVLSKPSAFASYQSSGAPDDYPHSRYFNLYAEVRAYRELSDIKEDIYNEASRLSGRNSIHPYYKKRLEQIKGQSIVRNIDDFYLDTMTERFGPKKGYFYGFYPAAMPLLEKASQIATVEVVDSANNNNESNDDNNTITFESEKAKTRNALLQFTRALDADLESRVQSCKL